FPPRQESTDKDGVTTIVEYRLNDEGKKVKVTRKIKRTLVKTAVNHVVAERMGFGQEKGAAPGPHSATTTVGENVRLRIQAGGIKKDEPAEDPMANMRAQLADKKVTCRYCSGDHFTARCPYKDTLGAALGEGEEAPPSDVPASDDPSAVRAAGGKYVPPSMRAGAKGVGESMNRGRDDYPTLRVTNLSEDARDDDLWELFGRFGKINRCVWCPPFRLASPRLVTADQSTDAHVALCACARSIYVGKDQETGLCKGFGFVSFESRSDAEAAMKKVHGLPYDHLILQVQWSVPKGEQPEKR
ncbi:SPOSA6832_02690, partial [Sporobolomyces salmonicolor]